MADVNIVRGSLGKVILERYLPSCCKQLYVHDHEASQFRLSVSEELLLLCLVQSLLDVSITTV